MCDVDNRIPGADNGTEVHDRVEWAAELFGKYGEEILAVIRFNVDDQSKAYDIFQDFFISLVRKPVPRHIENVRKYLYKAVTNDVIDSFRRTRDRQNNAQRYAYTRKPHIPREDPQDAVIHSEETKRMLQLIEDHLPKRESKVLLMRCSDGLSTADTAQTLRLTRRTVTQYLSMAMRKVRRLAQNKEIYE